MAKKKIDTFISELATVEDKAKNISSLNYIKSLASTSITDIGSWDIVKIFLSEDGKNLHSDKKTINKLFFENLLKIKEKTKKKIQELEKLKAEQEKQNANDIILSEDADEAKKQLAQLDLVNADISQAIKSTKSFEERKCEDNINSLTRSLNSHYTNITSLHAQLGEYQRKLLSYKVNPEEITRKIKAQLSNIISKGLWVNPIYSNGFLYLNLPTNVILTQVNKAANLDISLDVGRFAVKIDMKNGFQKRVIPYKDNIIGANRSFYHPHVSDYGSICWGNASSTYVKMISEFELDKALILLHALLHTYSDTHPYISLAEMHSAHKPLTVNANFKAMYPDLIHPDFIKKEKEDAQKDQKVAAGQTPLQVVAPITSQVVTVTNSTF